MNEAAITIDDGGNGIKVANISGQLDESNVDEKIQDLYKVVEQTPKGLKLIFDLENLEYMNSKSIGYLTDLYGKITESGGKVVIAKARPNIIDILQVVGLTQLINSYDSLEEAKTAIASVEGAPAPKAAPTEAPAEAPAPEATPAEAPAEAVAPEAAPAATEPAATEPVATTEAPAETPAPEDPVVPATPETQPAEPATEEISVEPAPAVSEPTTPEAAPVETPTAPVEPATPAEPAPVAPEVPTTAAPEAPVETPAEASAQPAVPANPNEEGGTYKFEK